MSVDAINAIASLKLPPKVKLVLFWLHHRTTDDTTAWPSRGDISAATCIPLRTVARILEELAEGGHIKPCGFASKGVVVYQLCHLGGTRVPKSIPGVPLSPPAVPFREPGVPPQLAHKVKNREQEEMNTPPTPPPWKGEARRWLDEMSDDNHPHQTDAELLRKAADGDLLAWKRLHCSLERDTLSFIRRMKPSHGKAS